MILLIFDAYYNYQILRSTIHTSIIFFAFIVLLNSCKIKDKYPGNTFLQTVMETDKAFSERCQQVGMKKAFIEYMDIDGILLRPYHLPIVGAEAIDYLSQENDSSYTLTWKPSSGEVASSGDLGFTYGIYSLRTKDTLLNGTYVSVWKKAKDGKWKFVLDSGNEGVKKRN